MTKEILIGKSGYGPSEDVDPELGAILSAANGLGLRHPEEVRNIKKVDELTSAEAASFVVDNIKESLKKGNVLVIEDGSHGLAYGISLSEGDSVEITRVDRFHSDEKRRSGVEKTVFQRPIYRAEFTEDKKFRLFIEEENKDNILEISSDGNFGPPAFLIASYTKREQKVFNKDKVEPKLLGIVKLLDFENIILGRLDARNSFTNIWNPVGWVVSGPRLGI